MSHTTYNKQWVDAQAALSDLLVYETADPKVRKAEKDRLSFFQLLATMYVRYIQIFRRLEQCYDQVVHPQKRRVMKSTLDGVIGRVLELKAEMAKNDASDFHYFDDIIADLKLTPNDIELPIPKYYILERAKQLKEREKFFAQILARIGFKEQETKEEIKISLPEAIRLIQMHERARQGRERARIVKEIRQPATKAASRPVPTIDPNVAATRIQKVWRGVMARRRVKELREQEFLLLGMVPPPPLGDPKESYTAIAARIEAHRRLQQDSHEQEYQQALVNIKEKLREQEGPSMRETMMDQIRQWFIECRDATGKFPDFPDEDDGGSASIFKERDPAELAKELAEREESGGKKKGGKKSGKKDKKGKKSAKGKKGGKKGKKGKDDDDEEGFKLGPSEFVPSVNDGTKSFESMWKTRDETHNFSQKYDAELVREEKRTEVESEIRLQVDELMREELKNLKMAVDRDSKKKKSGKKKKKKKKSGKKKKKRKEKDLTPDRAMEDLFEELVSEGVIVRCPKVQLSDYLGEFHYLATTLRQASLEPQPSLSDVRRVLTEYAILPLGSAAVHEKAPLIRSLMIGGPRGTGKNMLVNAICTETGANLFDLTATNIAGKYPGKDGLKMLMHLVFKVGRALQPSVILVDNCERMYKKKVPKGDTSEPKRLKKVFPKLIKTIGPEDRLLLVGLTSTPWDGDKAMTSLYNKIILVPRPDYASRHLLWRAMITKANGIVTSALDITSLTKISDGYTMGQMAQCCSQVLSDRRIAHMPKKPLTAIEFVQPLAKIDPVYKEEEDSFKTWYENHTPMGKLRKKLARGDEDDGGKGKGKGKGKKGGKKGKKKK